MLTSDADIRLLNKAHRGKDNATDVLSFPLHDEAEVSPGSVASSLGDIVISLDTTRTQAKEFKVTYQQEFLRLLIHGFLHLLGYDHEGVSKSEAAKMRRLEVTLRRMFSQEASSL